MRASAKQQDMGKAGYTAKGKGVMLDGCRIATAVTPVHALLIVAALTMRRHHPVISDGEVICSRCQAALPHDGHEPCIPRTPRCPETPDMFASEEEVPAVRTGSHG